MRDSAAALAYLTGRTETGARPGAIGQKFRRSGEVKPFAGNTTLCHVPEGPAHEALREAQTRLREGPHAEAFTFLPPASFHMTIFEGITDARRREPVWPVHLPLDASVEAVTEDFTARLKAHTLPPRLRARAAGIFGGFSVTMEGADAAAEAELRAARAQLASLLNIHRPDHNSYVFHITLGYLLRWLSDAEAEAVIALCAELDAALLPALEGLALGPIEFCQFEDMHHFEPLLRLG